MTKKQIEFVRNKLCGLSNRMAVIAAGYSPASAKQMGTYLMKHPYVRRELIKGNFDFGSARTFVSAAFRHSDRSWQRVATTMPKEHYDCPIEFLTHAMNCHELPIAARLEFAKTLLPYQHAKVES